MSQIGLHRKVEKSTMSTLPPPIPGTPKSGPSRMQPPPISGVGGGVKQPVIHAEDYVRASKLPVIIAMVATVISLVIAVVLHKFSTWIDFVGYLLTPFLVIACAGLDSVQQRRKSATDAYFLENRGYSKLLRLLSGLSILISIPHINGIATTVAAWVAKL